MPTEAHGPQPQTPSSVARPPARQGSRSMQAAEAAADAATVQSHAPGAQETSNLSRAHAITQLRREQTPSSPASASPRASPRFLVLNLTNALRAPAKSSHNGEQATGAAGEASTNKAIGKGQIGSALMRSRQNICFLTDFLGGPVNLFLSSQKCQGVPVPAICQNS